MTPRKLLKIFLFLLFFPFIFTGLALVFTIRTLERLLETNLGDDEM